MPVEAPRRPPPGHVSSSSNAITMPNYGSCFVAAPMPDQLTGSLGDDGSEATLLSQCRLETPAQLTATPARHDSCPAASSIYPGQGVTGTPNTHRRGQPDQAGDAPCTPQAAVSLYSLQAHPPAMAMHRYQSLLQTPCSPCLGGPSWTHSPQQSPLQPTLLSHAMHPQPSSPLPQQSASGLPFQPSLTPHATHQQPSIPPPQQSASKLPFQPTSLTSRATHPQPFIPPPQQSASELPLPIQAKPLQPGSNLPRQSLFRPPPQPGPTHPQHKHVGVAALEMAPAQPSSHPPTMPTPAVPAQPPEEPPMGGYPGHILACEVGQQPDPPRQAGSHAGHGADAAVPMDVETASCPHEAGISRHACSSPAGHMEHASPLMGAGRHGDESRQHDCSMGASSRPGPSQMAVKGSPVALAVPAGASAQQAVLVRRHAATGGPHIWPPQVPLVGQPGSRNALAPDDCPAAAGDVGLQTADGDAESGLGAALDGAQVPTHSLLCRPSLLLGQSCLTLQRVTSFPAFVWME